MSYDLALNRLDHDLVFQAIPDTSKYQLYFIEGQDRVAQQIKINLLSFLGEWFLDNTYGVPYLEEILIKNPRMPSVETILRSHINSIPDMIRIDSLDLEWDRQKRFLKVTFACTTNLGPIQGSFRLDVMRR